MYNTLNVMPDYYKAGIYIRLSEADEGKSYEVSKKSPAKSINPDYMPYVVIVILIVGILVGAGYMKHRK